MSKDDDLSQLIPQTIYVDQETFDAILAMLDEEPKVNPKLVELFNLKRDIT